MGLEERLICALRKIQKDYPPLHSKKGLCAVHCFDCVLLKPITNMTSARAKALVALCNQRTVSISSPEITQIIEDFCEFHT